MLEHVAKTVVKSVDHASLRIAPRPLGSDFARQRKSDRRGSGGLAPASGRRSHAGGSRDRYLCLLVESRGKHVNRERFGSRKTFGLEFCNLALEDLRIYIQPFQARAVRRRC